MSDTAAIAALAGSIRGLRVSAEEHKPSTVEGRSRRVQVIGFLLYAELAAQLLAEELPEAPPAHRPPQQFHAPLGDYVEPRVPRRPSHHP